MHTKTIAILTLGVGVVGGWAAEATLKDSRDKVSYAIGMNLGSAWQRQAIDVDLDLVMRGIKEAQAGGATLMTEAEAREALGTFQRELRVKQEEGRKLQAEKNKTEGEKFLAENKTKPGIVALPSGLQYKVVQDGQGASPKAYDTVTVHYKGTLLDGTEFDSSYKRGEPASFEVKNVIRGWTEALQLMKPGAKWQLFIPAELAYGASGAGQTIGPNAVLQFEVELLSVKPGTPPVEAPAVTSDIIKVPSKEELEKGAKIEIIKPEDLEKLKAQEALKAKEKK